MDLYLWSEADLFRKLIMLLGSIVFESSLIIFSLKNFLRIWARFLHFVEMYFTLIFWRFNKKSKIFLLPGNIGKKKD